MSPRCDLRSLAQTVHGDRRSAFLAGFTALAAGLALAPVGAEAAGRHATTIIPTGAESTMGVDQYMHSGAATALGDANGDGLDDIATTTTQGLGSSPQSAARVVFGASSANYPSALNGLGMGGFSIRGGVGGVGVTSAGDFDGDGLKDLLVNRRIVVYGARGNDDVLIDLAGSARTTILTIPTGSDGFRSVGDFNGDGRDDLASSGDHQRTSYALVTLGGPRVTTIASTGARTLRMVGWRRCVPIVLTPYGPAGGCKDYADVPEAAGDVNGDGFDDLLVRQNAVAAGDRDTVIRTWVLFGRAAAGGKAVDIRKAVAPSAANVSEPGVESWWASVGPVLAWRDGPGQDFDRDGFDDLVVTRRSGGTTVSGYLPGVAGTADFVLSEATVRPSTASELGEAYDPRVASTPDTSGLANVAAVGDLDGDGRLDGAAVWRKYADIAPGTTDPVYPRGALVIFDGDEDRLAPVQYPHDPAASFGTPEVSGWYDGLLRFGAFEDSRIETVWRRVGETQPIQVVTFPVGTETIPSWSNMFDRKPLEPGRYEVVTTAIDAAGNRSKPLTWPFEVKPPGDYGLLEPLSGPSWQTFRAATKLGDGSVVLTPAAPTVQGAVWWALPINRWAQGTNTVTSVEFDAEMSGGSPAGGGMTFAITEKPPGVEAMPGTGSSLGFAPQSGTAFAMQTYKATRTDPSANFVGFTHGAIPGAKPVALKWVATADPLIDLRAAPFRVKVEISALRKQAWINGVLVLTAPGESNSAKYLQFTASTGPGQNQRHVVRNVVFKQRFEW